uniref:Uncharacterized protein n=1 Tax=Lepeophtheirus salmonis TaxID=72036 RepID=A0A0K2SYJ8_LEPSM
MDKDRQQTKKEALIEETNQAKSKVKGLINPASQSNIEETYTSEKRGCSNVVIPFELPIEIPPGLPVEYNVEGPEKNDDGKFRTMVHVQVNRSNQPESGTTKYSGVDTWAVGYNDVSDVFQDITTDLKIRDAKANKQLEDRGGPCQKAFSQSSFKEKRAVSMAPIDPYNISEGNLIFSGSEETLVGLASANNDSDCVLSWEGNRGKKKDSKKDTFHALESNTVEKDATNKLPVKKTKEKRKHQRTMNVTGYSFDMDKARGLILKHIPGKGTCVLTAECPTGMKIVEARERAGIVIKISPDKPLRLRVVRK